MKTKPKKSIGKLPKSHLGKEERKTYVGIADCHGIEYFQGKDEPRSIPLQMRAALYRQRHALYYEVDLTLGQANQVRMMLEGKDFATALSYLKVLHGAGTAELGVEEEMQESIKLIPDPKLDPFGG